MAWKYSQSTGRLTYNGKLVATGYSGSYGYVNRPECEMYKDRGAIPSGTYRIGAGFKRGRQNDVMRLEPTMNVCGRNGFLIHGDIARADHKASEGCVIFGPAIRHRISTSGDRTFQVIP
jgi:hypothetical protein